MSVCIVPIAHLSVLEIILTQQMADYHVNSNNFNFLINNFNSSEKQNIKRNNNFTRIKAMIYSSDCIESSM